MEPLSDLTHLRTAQCLRNSGATSPPQVPHSDRVPCGCVQNRPVGIESDLVDLVLSCWDGDGAAGARRTAVPGVDLTGGPEETRPVETNVESDGRAKGKGRRSR